LTSLHVELLTVSLFVRMVSIFPCMFRSVWYA